MITDQHFSRAALAYAQGAVQALARLLHFVPALRVTTRSVQILAVITYAASR